MNNFKWVALATAPNDERHFMRYVHVFDGHMYATDGFRIHRAKTDLKRGLYDPTTGDQIGAVYPAYRHFANPFRFAFCSHRLIDLPSKYEEPDNKYVDLLFEVPISYRFLIDAVQDQRIGVEFSVRSDQKAIRGEYQDRTFVIMGVVFK
jgi:hypothetical protein